MNYYSSTLDLSIFSVFITSHPTFSLFSYHKMREREEALNKRETNLIEQEIEEEKKEAYYLSQWFPTFLVPGNPWNKKKIFTEPKILFFKTSFMPKLKKNKKFF